MQKMKILNTTEFSTALYGCEIMDIHGQNKKNVTGVHKLVLQKTHKSKMDKENNK